MPISVPVTKRIPKGSPLTAVEHDTNLTNLVTGIQTVDGRVDGINASITALDNEKLAITAFDAAFEGTSGGKKQVHWNNVTSKPPEQNFQTFGISDGTQRNVSGITSRSVLSSWTLSGVPSGDIFVNFQMECERVASGSDATGIVYVTLNGSDVIVGATHAAGGVAPGASVFITGFGTVSAFAGGTLTVEVQVSGEVAGFDMNFGVVGGDGRFGRKVGLITGL